MRGNHATQHETLGNGALFFFSAAVPDEITLYALLLHRRYSVLISFVFCTKLILIGLRLPLGCFVSVTRDRNICQTLADAALRRKIIYHDSVERSVKKVVSACIMSNRLLILERHLC